MPWGSGNRAERVEHLAEREAPSVHLTKTSPRFTAHIPKQSSVRRQGTGQRVASLNQGPTQRGQACEQRHKPLGRFQCCPSTWQRWEPTESCDIIGAQLQACGNTCPPWFPASAPQKRGHGGWRHGTEGLMGHGSSDSVTVDQTVID
jgi:hypothetical protein